MTLTDMQAELRYAYHRGGPGAVISGLVWVAATLTYVQAGVGPAFAVLFFGGMLIFPISTLVEWLIFRRPNVSKANQGGRIAFETVPPMIAGLLAAWLLLPHAPEYVFPISAIAVGAHYFGFRSAYGDATYIVLALIMIAVGSMAIFMGQPAGALMPGLIAVIEILFGIWLTAKGVKEPAPASLTTE